MKHVHRSYLRSRSEAVPHEPLSSHGALTQIGQIVPGVPLPHSAIGGKTLGLISISLNHSQSPLAAVSAACSNGCPGKICRWCKARRMASRIFSQWQAYRNGLPPVSQTTARVQLHMFEYRQMTIACYGEIHTKVY